MLNLTMLSTLLYASQPIGGHVLAHASTTRVFLKKGKDDERVAKIFDSPCVKEAECVFRIANGGIVDP
jgi:RecA/RadA recombinase